MEKGTTWVGLDVHQEQIVVAMLLGSEPKAVEWKVAHEAAGVKRLARELRQAGDEGVHCVYEAGPCGYALQRQLVALGVRCQVIAPSLVPRKPGDRIKTDRRDARKLAELLRAGLLTEVHPPTAEEEAVRDLCRCREDAREDLMRARHRVGKMLLRRGVRYRDGRAWTVRHRRWLWGLVWEHAAERAVFEDYLLALDQVEARLRGLEQKLAEQAQEKPYCIAAGWLRCFRGIDTITAMTLLGELHDIRRFRTPRQLMSYLGLVPSEHSSGERVRHGGITKAGNRHVRRVLVEAAWHYRHRPAVGRALRQRRQGQPAAVVALADRAQQRLHRRFHRLLLGRGKPAQQVVVAVARELAGFVWAALSLQRAPAAD